MLAVDNINIHIHPFALLNIILLIVPSYPTPPIGHFNYANFGKQHVPAPLTKYEFINYH